MNQLIFFIVRLFKTRKYLNTKTPGFWARKRKYQGGDADSCTLAVNVKSMNSTGLPSSSQSMCRDMGRIPSTEKMTEIIRSSNNNLNRIDLQLKLEHSQFQVEKLQEEIIKLQEENKKLQDSSRSLVEERLSLQTELNVMRSHFTKVSEQTCAVVKSAKERFAHRVS